MPERSATALLGILQRHGLSISLLELWVHFVEREQTGSVTLHHDKGHLRRYEVHATGKIACMVSADLTDT